MSVFPTSTEMEETSKIKPYQTMRGHTYINGVASLPDGRRIITCFADGLFRLWDRESGVQIGNDWRDDGDDGGARLFTIALSPDGKTVAAGNEDGTVRLWDVETGKVTAKWTGHSDVVRSVSWSANVERASVATSSNDGTVRVWDVERGETVLGPIKTGHQYVSAVAYSPDTSKIATGGLDDTAIKIWDARTGKLLSTLEQDSQVWNLTWTSDQKKLLAGWFDGSIRIFNTTTWEQIAILEGHTDLVEAICLFQNDRLLASVSDDSTARLWNLDTNLPVGPPLQHQGFVLDAALSADGKFLVTACGKDAYVWNTHTILEEGGLEHLLSLSNVAGVKSILNTDATRRPTRLKDTHTRVPRHFFDDAQDVAPAPSSTVHEDPPPAMPHTDTPPSIAHVDPHSSTTHADPPSSAHRRRHAFAFARPLFGRFAQRFLDSQLNTSEPSELQQRLAQRIVPDDAPSAGVPDGRNNQSDASRHLTQLNDPLRTPQSPLDDAQDHIHQSTPRIDLPSSLYRREAPAPVSRSGTRRGFSGFSRHFQRNTNTSIEFELQRRPTQNDVSAHGPTVVEVPEIRDKQALYVAPQPVRANRRRKNTWLARFFLFICCEPRV